MRNTKRKADADWLKTVLTSGTISDRLSARTLLIQVMLDIVASHYSRDLFRCYPNNMSVILFMTKYKSALSIACSNIFVFIQFSIRTTKAWYRDNTGLLPKQYKYLIPNHPLLKILMCY